MPPERTWKVRQEPVSCDSCRKKKLKCDRKPNCSNCVSRRIACHYQGRPQSDPLSGQSDDFASNELQEENRAIRERLQRLEAIVLQQQNSLPRSESRQQTPATTNVNNGGIHMDSQWLVAAGKLEASPIPNMTDPFTWRLADLPYIVEQATATVREPFRIYMPTRDLCVRLADSYVEHVEPMQHIIHLPDLMPLLHRVYDSLERETAVDPNELAFLLMVLTSISSYWSWGGPDCLFTLPEDAYSVSTYYLKLALDVLEQARRLARTTLGTVQTHIMIIFVIFRMDSFSAKGRYIHMNAITAARDIGLHILDAKDRRPFHPTREQIIDIEIKRRVWWHLCSTDWCLPLLGGSEEATYNIDPRRMRVDKPRNINDSDLYTQPPDFERPLTELTTMSYYLSRIRLGETCREVSDILWAWGGDDPIPYDWVLQVDKKFDDLSSNLPSALRFDESNNPNDSASSHLHPTLAVQRSFTRLTTQARRAKLHLPFMLRVAQNPQYSFSRDKCLQSARIMLSMRTLLPQSIPSSPSSSPPGPTMTSQNTTTNNNIPPHIRLSGVLHHFFIATVVLVMDLCVNRHLFSSTPSSPNTSSEEETRKAEIRDACRILEKAKTRSEPAGLFLDSLMATMRRHQLRLLGKDGEEEFGRSDGRKDEPALVAGLERLQRGMVPGMGPPESVGEGGNGTIMTEPAGGVSSTIDPALGSETMDFENMWKEYFDLDMGTTMMPDDWNALFNDLADVS